MANYCGKCGSPLDKRTGRCPECDKNKLLGTKKTTPKIVLVYIVVFLLLAAVLVLFCFRNNASDHSGVAQPPKCNHKWESVTCAQTTSCTLCGEVKVIPLTHVPGEWTDDLNPISCKLTRSVNCANCGALLEREEETLDSFVKDNAFVFTPRQFLERFTQIVELQFGTASYEVTPSDYGMIVNFYYGNNQTSLLNFLHSDMTAVSDKELDQKDVYCVSAFFPPNPGAANNASCMEEFLKACDPKLDDDHAFTACALCMTALQNALNEGRISSTLQSETLCYDVVLSPNIAIGASNDSLLGLAVYPAVSESVAANSPILKADTKPMITNHPVLKADYEISTDKETLGEPIPVHTVYGSTISRECIDSIKFLNSLADAPEDAWDVSEAEDGSVLAWVTPTSEYRYDLFIAGEGGVWAPEDCTYLFAEYRWMESLDFNNAFFVENCKTMRGMFFHDQSIKALDFSGWDTSTVKDMSEMFNFCSNIEKLDLSQFDTSSVTNMHDMFMRCESIKKLDLRSFDTSSVTDMSGMFFQSWYLENLDLSNFDTSRVVDIGGMFFGCMSLKKLDISSFDTSSVEESMGIFSGSLQLSELKVGPEFDISILREEADSMPYMAEGGTINGYPWESFLKQ